MAEVSRGFDSGTLLPPMNTSKRGLQQALDVIRNGTPNIKQLLLQEADLIYECRVCKSLFRGLANFVEHKQSYCKMRSGIEQHIASKAVGLNLGGLYPSEDAAAPYVEPQPPTLSPVSTRSVQIRPAMAPVINDQSAEVGNADAFVILRPIPATTEAIEQQVVRSDHIVNHDELEKLSIFAPKPEGEDTSKIVGEIAIRQAAKGQTSKVEKRDALHNILKNVGGKSSTLELSFDVASVPSPVSPKGKDIVAAKKKECPNQSGVVVLQMSSQQEAKDKSPGGVPCQATECTICKKKCKNWTALAWHMRIHKRPVFKCSICRYNSDSVYNLRRHMQTMHHLPTTRVDEMLSRKVEQHKSINESREKPGPKDGETSPSSAVPTCDICFKTFASRRNVLRHKEIHRRKQTSAEPKRIGAKLTPSQEEIARAKVMQIMDEKNLKCRRCQKQLATMRRLQQHCCNHFGYNRYRCKLCPYENNDYTQMRRHMMGKHGRQFRTIYQISEAIRNMKIGIWVNLVNSSPRTDDEKNAASSEELNVACEKMTSVKNKTETQITPKKENTPAAPALHGDLPNGLGDHDNNAGGTHCLDEMANEAHQSAVNDEEEEEEDEDKGSKEEDEEEMDTEETEEEEKNPKSSSVSNKSPKKENNKNTKSLSNKENKVTQRTPAKQQQTTSKNGHLTPPNSTSRKSPDPTPSRDIPIRQARLNHQNVSPRNQQEKTNVEKTSSDRLTSVRRDLISVKREPNSVKREMNAIRRDLTKSQNQTTKSTVKDEADDDRNVLEMLMDKRLGRCLNCNKQYKHHSSLQRHVRIHLLRGEVKVCPNLPTTSPADTERKYRIIESLINSNLLKCLKCRKRFESMSSLKRHVARHLGYSSFKCKFCGYLSRNYTWFKHHLTVKHGDQIRDVSQMGSLMASMKTKK